MKQNSEQPNLATMPNRYRPLKASYRYPFSSLAHRLCTGIVMLALLSVSTSVISATKNPQLEKAKKLVRTRHYDEAAQLYRKLAEGGNAEAQYRLANMLRSGIGIQKDIQSAVVWFRKSAEQGYKEAEYTLATLYDSGTGVAQDQNQARIWYERAAKHGHRKAISALKRLAEKDDHLQKQPKNILAEQFRHAARQGNLKKLQKLLKTDPRIIDMTDENGRTALIEATIENHPDIVRWLLSRHADIDHANRFGDTALHIAATNGFVKIVDLLARNHANLNVQDKNGNTALILATLADHPNIVRLLLSRHADFNLMNHGKETPIQIATDKKRKEIVRLLQQFGATLPRKKATKTLNLKNLPVEDPLYTGWPPLAIAAWRGQHDFVDKLIVNQPEQINQQDKEGFTPLMRAVMKNRLKSVKALLTAGAEVNLVNRQGRSALHYAVELPSTAITRLLLKKGAKSSFSDRNGNTPIHLTVQENRPKQLSLLLKAGAAGVIDKANKSGKTPLVLAVEKNLPGMVEMLLDAGADPEQTTRNRRSLVQLAAEHGGTEILALLKKHGVSLTAPVVTGNTPLMLATANGHVETMAYLIQNGVDVNERNAQDNSALIIAAMTNQTEAALLLLRHNAKPGLRNNKRERAIDFAKQHHNQTLIRLLKIQKKKGDFLDFFK
ncbi:MAG: hypothetical protein D6698_10835 [Gammaproteobacteria bacterium]|nr:MAG: hypothetical protein D6698_10835 [Gammaproteobacteria bacterium]